MHTQGNFETLDPQEAHNKQQLQKSREIFELQQRAFRESPFPEEKLRKQQLVALRKAIIKHQDKLVKAISADFGCRSFDETLLADILPTVLNIDHTIKHLREWMKPEKRSVAMLFQPAQARIMYQPLGVVGIMAPWNYPVYLSLGPLIAAIAAGNRAMIKPSEYCPYGNRVLNEIIEDAFSVDEVCMIEGGADVAAEFTQLPFDHLLFTGSTNVGKKVMAAAAENLTPVTLELGGKSPAIVAPDVTADFAVERILYGKCLNAGQTCVAPDYILCPEDKLDELISAFKTRFQQLYPDIDNGDYTSIVNDAQHARLKSWLKDAQEKGAEIISLAEPGESRQRSMPLQLVTKVNTSMTIMQEEIFGPILPIIAYKDLKQAIQIVHSQPRPLALYLFTLSQRLENQVLRHTHAGGVCINDTVTHVGQDDLPFGGIGPSGMGSYHAREGFLTFSKAKSIFKRGRFNSAKMAFPPYGNLVHRLIYRWYLR
ncbi:coniferyl aldehyde dehydrogenase [Aliikangiella coralliicola]|uniref:Aldehyde dehydrogenase n=1 Tax=Aliikangiella coralliicola TaxID=2592383 RepID=A0A545UGA0_9GAMM|nr:coniferyl aldehyde dehydrogenase [Aliikangiella coralliicola]TQV88423.1 coniferyl aldehyde dehydrogenase [Aliikangiella coralliicola]